MKKTCKPASSKDFKVGSLDKPSQDAIPVANEGLVVGIPDPKNVSCHPCGHWNPGRGPHPTLRLVCLFLETC